MSSRGLESLLAMPSALRRVVLQAALTAPTAPPSSFLAPALGLSQSRSYAKKATGSAARKPTSSLKKKAPGSSTKKSKVSPARKPTSSLKTKAPISTKKAIGSAVRKPASTLKKKAPSSSTKNAAATPTTKKTRTAPPSVVQVDPNEDPPRTLSFLPTPPPVVPPSVVLADLPPPDDITRTTTLFRDPKFLYSAPRFLHLPFNTHVPEVCILGRSNVGKSTLINALAGFNGKKAGTSHGSATNSRGIAITSAKAGCTKTMNAYGFGPPARVKPLTKAEQEKRKEGGRARSDRRKASAARGAISPERMPKFSLVLMDMPGYGLNSRENWGTQILKYLHRREILSGAVLLIDAVAGVKEGDKMVLRTLMDAGLKTSVVMTKADKLVTQPDPELWKNSELLKQACSHIYDELRAVEKKGDGKWCEGVDWTPEIFITGAGDPKMGGMGIDGARLAICRLAGLIAEPVRKVEGQQPEVVPFDQLVFAEPSSTQKYPVRPQTIQEAVEDIPVGRVRLRTRRLSRRNLNDPMTAMEAAIMRPKRGRALGQASF